MDALDPIRDLAPLEEEIFDYLWEINPSDVKRSYSETVLFPIMRIICKYRGAHEWIPGQCGGNINHDYCAICCMRRTE
jgi:hypothetical protein